MDGILAAQLAKRGFEGAKNTLEVKGGLTDLFIREGNPQIPPLDFGVQWDLLRNGFKYYACCRATHSSTQAASSLAERVAGREIARIRGKVHVNALVTANKRNPVTPFESKFSVAFCIAMGLRGYKGMMSDFSAATLAEPEVMKLLPLVELEADPSQDSQTAYLDVWLKDGTHLSAHTDVVKGHPDNPMSWTDLELKFKALVAPALGDAVSDQLFKTAQSFERAGSLQKIGELLTR
jgi:2-methylcitrate dehydratase PrpD